MFLILVFLRKCYVSIELQYWAVVQHTGEKQLIIDKRFLFSRPILFHQTQWRMMVEVIKHLPNINTIMRNVHILVLVY